MCMMCVCVCMGTGCSGVCVFNSVYKCVVFSMCLCVMLCCVCGGMCVCVFYLTRKSQHGYERDLLVFGGYGE